MEYNGKPLGAEATPSVCAISWSLPASPSTDPGVSILQENLGSKYQFRKSKSMYSGFVNKKS